MKYTADQGPGAPRAVRYTSRTYWLIEISKRTQLDPAVRPSADSNLAVKPSSSRRARQRQTTREPSCRDRTGCEHGSHLQTIRAFTLPLLGFGLRALLSDTLSFPHHLVTGL